MSEKLWSEVWKWSQHISFKIKQQRTRISDQHLSTWNYTERSWKLIKVPQPRTESCYTYIEQCRFISQEKKWRPIILQIFDAKRLNKLRLTINMKTSSLDKIKEIPSIGRSSWYHHTLHHLPIQHYFFKWKLQLCWKPLNTHSD